MALDIVGPANAPNAVTARPVDTRSFGVSDTWVKDCSSPTANDGTKVQAGFVNALIGQLRNLIRGNGQTAGSVDIVTADNTDDAMALKAVQHLIQRGLTNYALDTGTANALVVSLSPAVAELKSGLIVRIKKSATANGSGSVTLALNGNPAKPVLRMDGSALRTLDLPANCPFQAQYDLALDAFIVTNFQPGVLALAANKTIYVNGAIGNDANDGVSNIAGHALATLQGAINLAWSYAPSQYTITIIVEPGTYAGCRTPLYPGPSVVIDGLNKANVTISSGTDYGILVQGPNTMTVQNVTVQNISSVDGPSGLAATSAASMTTQNTASNSCGGGVFGAGGGAVVSVGNHTFNGNCYACWRVSSLGTIQLLQGSTYTFSAAITVALATVFAGGPGVFAVSASVPVTFVNPGNVAGPKYSAIANGVINVNGQGTSFLPGSSAGATATGGQYV